MHTLPLKAYTRLWAPWYMFISRLLVNFTPEGVVVSLLFLHTSCFVSLDLQNQHRPSHIGCLSQQQWMPLQQHRLLFTATLAAFHSKQSGSAQSWSAIPVGASACLKPTFGLLAACSVPLSYQQTRCSWTRLWSVSTLCCLCLKLPLLVSMMCIAFIS